MEQNKLIKITTNEEEIRITSVELVDIINTFREEESKLIGESKLTKPLLHKNLIAKINKEIAVLKLLGDFNELNFKLVEYKDAKGETRPCYSLNRDGMLQILNSESTLVRYKTIEYINHLEEENKQLKQSISREQELVLSIYNGGIEAVEATKELIALKEEEAKRPLLDKIEQDRPLVEFSNAIASSSDSLDMGKFAKLIKEEGVFNGGRNKLFAWLRNNGYLMKDNTPYQRFIEQGLFEIVEYTYTTPYGEKLGTKTLCTGKGQIYFVEKLRTLKNNSIDK